MPLPFLACFWLDPELASASARPAVTSRAPVAAAASPAPATPAVAAAASASTAVTSPAPARPALADAAPRLRHRPGAAGRGFRVVSTEWGREERRAWGAVERGGRRRVG